MPRARPCTTRARQLFPKSPLKSDYVVNILTFENLCQIFHRVIPGFMCQGGDFTKADGECVREWVRSWCV
jgi:hypothetical protein